MINNMKKYIYIFLFIIPIFSFSQKTEKLIKKQFLDYTDLIVKKDFSTALDKYANESFFKIVPKETLLQGFKILFNNPEMEFYFGDANVKSVELIDKKINNQYYAKIFYSQKLGIKLKSLEEIKDEQEKQEKSNTYLAVFKSQFGEDNVKYNTKTGFFNLLSNKYCVANSDNLKNWKFTVAEKKQQDMLEKFLPKELLTDLK